jgi:hypothetical protein
MHEKSLTNKTDEYILSLKQKATKLKDEVSLVEQKINAFEDTLRSELSNQIIEVYELTTLYKKIKQSKKEKRSEQKKRGKNHKPNTNLQPVPSNKKSSISEDDKKEKKRLYRETMLHVHPDKYSLNSDQEELSTNITTKLIEIYQSGTLAELQDYHTHIFSGQTDIEFTNKPKVETIRKISDTYLLSEITKLEDQLKKLKDSELYQVFTEYKNPLTFAEELKVYYNDRIFKLKKRTRKG